MRFQKGTGTLLEIRLRVIYEMFCIYAIFGQRNWLPYPDILRIWCICYFLAAVRKHLMTQLENGNAHF